MNPSCTTRYRRVDPRATNLVLGNGKSFWETTNKVKDDLYSKVDFYFFLFLWFAIKDLNLKNVDFLSKSSLWNL